jgi:hypothetical protein
MIVSRTHPRTFDALLSLVHDAARGAQSVVMQAGHFLLYYDIVEDCILPCVSGELTSPRHELIRHEAGNFPLLTWQLGLELLDSLQVATRHAMVLVNDWQYLPKNIERRRFYESFGHLPDGYINALERYEDRLQLLGPPQGSGTHPFYSEMNLRNQYKKAVERLITNGTLPSEAILEQRTDEIVCSLPDAVGRTREVYCSNKTGDCAAEVAQMLSLAVKQADCDCFINIYPAVCRDFVELGTELGNDLLRINLPNVINIGFPTNGVESREDLLVSCEVAWHRFGNVSTIPSMATRA